MCEITPDTLNYLVSGYGIGLGIVALLVGSMWWRFRNLIADEATVRQLEAEITDQKPLPSS